MEELKHTWNGYKVMKSPLQPSSGLKIALSLSKICNPCFWKQFNLNRQQLVLKSWRDLRKSWHDSVLSKKLFKLGFLKSCHKIAIVTRFNQCRMNLIICSKSWHVSTIVSRFYFLQNLQLFMLSLLLKLACELKTSWKWH